MRILLLSDIHANPWALRAVERASGDVDNILFAGDAVNYGPAPREVIEWLRAHSVIAVQGNHDHAVVRSTDPRASAAKRRIATMMRDWTRSELAADDLEWLDQLPLMLNWQTGGVRFAIRHATAGQDPLYDYRLQPSVADDELQQLIGEVDADVVVCGHTHLPFVRKLARGHVTNPGSVGQPLDGDPRASYAIWQDGKLTLERVDYEREAVTRLIHRLPLPTDVRESLATTLQWGRMALRPGH